MTMYQGYDCNGVFSVDAWFYLGQSNYPLPRQDTFAQATGSITRTLSFPQVTLGTVSNVPQVASMVRSPEIYPLIMQAVVVQCFRSGGYLVYESFIQD